MPWPAGRSSWRSVADDRGTAVPEYVGMVVLASILVGSVASANLPSPLACVVHRAVQRVASVGTASADQAQQCEGQSGPSHPPKPTTPGRSDPAQPVPAGPVTKPGPTGPDPKPGPTGPDPKPGPTVPDTEPNPALSPPVEPPCAKDVVTVGAVTYIGVGCRYVPLPGRCVDLLPAAGAAPPAGTDPLASAAACAGGTIGGPDPDPNAPACSEALPNPYPDSDRTTAQVGCRDWVVPVSCTSLLEALEALPPASIDAAQAAQALADCITTWYDRNEENCVVNQSLGVERTEVVAFFFITWGKSKGFLVEEFGDAAKRDGGVDAVDPANTTALV